MPTYNQLVTDAILNLKQRGGASRQAITKYIKENNSSFNATALRNALKSDDFVQTGQRFTLTAAKKSSASAAAKKARKRAPKGKLPGKGYHVKIGGKNYDREMVEAANKAVEGANDSLISVKDAKLIVAAALDGNQYTKTEQATMAYIRDNYQFTAKADEYVRKQVASFSAKRRKTSGKKTTKKKGAAKKKTSSKKKTTTKKKSTAAKKKTTTKKKAKTVKKPTTYLDFAAVAIKAVKGRKGASRPAIKNYIAENNDLETVNAPALRKALAKGVASGQFVQVGQRFFLPK